MVEKARILLIDDNEHSRHDLETVLSFLGEETVSANSSNWHSRTSEVTGQTTQIDVAIIGVCEFIPLELLLSEIYQWEPGIPFVLGSQRDIRNYAGQNGWITQNETLNTLYKTNSSSNLVLLFK